MKLIALFLVVVTLPFSKLNIVQKAPSPIILLNIEPVPVQNVINSYTPVIDISIACENKITVGDASEFKAGDTVLLIQMKGATVDSSNSTAFGTITD